MTLAPAERRAQRFQRKGVLQRTGAAIAAQAGDWDAVPYRRVASCGFVNIEELITTKVRYGDDGPTAFNTGVATCSSVWSCPTCSAKIRTRRSMEVAAVAQGVADLGGSLGMLTLTVRHGPEHSLEELMDAQAAAWRSLQQSPRWRHEVRPLLLGMVRSWEVTHGFFKGEGGSWHPHFHVLFAWKPGVEVPDLDWIESAWRSRIKARLGVAPNQHGVDYRPIASDAAEYVAKIGHEMTRSDLKGKSAQVWQLIDAIEAGERWAHDRYCEYVTATRGKRAIQFSRGMRAAFGLDELSDEEIATMEVEAEYVEQMTPRAYRRLWNYRGYRVSPAICGYLSDIEANYMLTRVLVG